MREQIMPFFLIAYVNVCTKNARINNLVATWLLLPTWQLHLSGSEHVYYNFLNFKYHKIIFKEIKWNIFKNKIQNIFISFLTECIIKIFSLNGFFSWDLVKNILYLNPVKLNPMFWRFQKFLLKSFIKVLINEEYFVFCILLTCFLKIYVNWNLLRHNGKKIKM